MLFVALRSLMSLRVVLHMTFLICKHASECCDMLDDSSQDVLKLNSLAMYFKLAQHICIHEYSRLQFAATKKQSFQTLPTSVTVRTCFCAHFIQQAQN